MTGMTFAVRRTCQGAASGLYALSAHAWMRMTSRRMSPSDVEMVLNYGKVHFVKKCKTFVVGRRQLRQFPQLSERLSTVLGTHVLTSHDNTILTVYKNQKLRSLHGGRRGGRHRRGQLRRLTVQGRRGSFSEATNA